LFQFPFQFQADDPLRFGLGWPRLPRVGVAGRGLEVSMACDGSGRADTLRALRDIAECGVIDAGIAEGIDPPQRLSTEETQVYYSDSRIASSLIDPQ
jgi:hypothetical protein